MTPAEYEHAELERMIKNIQQLEQQISDMNTGDSRTSKNPGGTGGAHDGTSSQGGLKNSYQNSFMGKMFTNQKGTEESNSYNNSKGGIQPNIFASTGQGSKEKNSKGSKDSHYLSAFGAPAL